MNTRQSFERPDVVEISFAQGLSIVTDTHLSRRVEGHDSLRAPSEVRFHDGLCRPPRRRRVVCATLDGLCIRRPTLADVADTLRAEAVTSRQRVSRILIQGAEEHGLLVRLSWKARLELHDIRMRDRDEASVGREVVARLRRSSIELERRCNLEHVTRSGNRASSLHRVRAVFAEVLGIHAHTFEARRDVSREDGTARDKVVRDSLGAAAGSDGSMTASARQDHAAVFSLVANAAPSVERMRALQRLFHRFGAVLDFGFVG